MTLLRDLLVLPATLFVLCSSYSVAHAQFRSIETDNLRLVYFGAAQSYLTSHVARCFENSLRFHRTLFDYSESERTTVFLTDFTDYGNAGAGVLPWNHISLDIAPYSYAFETSPANERMNSTMNHELVHIVASNQTAPSDRFFRTLFGGKVAETSEHPLTILYSYLTTPRRSAPRWYHEGIAVYLETWMAGGYGRALGAYDEMVFRTKVCDSSVFYDRIGLESEGVAIDFQGGANSYLYGTRFMTFLSIQYGPDKLIEWVKRSDSSSAFYSSQFKRVYGKSLDEAWSEWIAFEYVFQAGNLNSIREYPVTEARNISSRPLGSVSRSFYDSTHKCIYSAIYYPGEHASLSSISIVDGSITKLCDVKGPALYYVSSLAFDPKKKLLFYTSDNNEYRDLCSYNIETGKQKVLMKDERVGDLAFNTGDESIWGVRHYNGISTLVRMPPPYDKWKQVYSFPYGSDIYDIDVSPDGQIVIGSLAEINGKQSLIRMNIPDLISGDTTFSVLHDFMNSIPENFTFSSDGKYLLGTSCYTGVSNVFRYDFVDQSMGTFSNAETGFFRPMPYGTDSLLIFRFGTEGFSPAIIQMKQLYDVNAITYLGQVAVEKDTILKSWIAPPPSSVPLDSITTHRGDYNVFTSIRPTSFYPIVEGYKNNSAVGMMLNLSGPIGLPRADLSLSYSPNSSRESERLHVKAHYQWLNWSFDFGHNAADFYDLFGPTKTSRKGTFYGMKYEKTLLQDDPRSANMTVSVKRYAGLDRLPTFQNIVTSFSNFVAVNMVLSGQSMRSSIGAVDREDGYRWTYNGTHQFVSGQIFTRLSADLDAGVSLPIPHTSLWLRSSAGYSPTRRDEPLANFYFGGFGNNWIDYQPEKQYRQRGSFPGTEIDEIGGNNYVRVMTEITLPPVRFRRLGFSSLYCNWLRAALFATELRTNIDDQSTRLTARNIGAQVDCRMTLLSHLKLTLSYGYAAVFQESSPASFEQMISLKLL